MSKGIRYSCKTVFICAVIAIAAIGAALLVDFFPPSPRQNVPVTKQARSGLSGVVNRLAGVAGSPAHQLVANYGKLPLSFEANQGQVNGPVEFLARGHAYTLFLTGGEAVLALKKPGAWSQEPNEPIKPIRLDRLDAFLGLLRPDAAMDKRDSRAPGSARSLNSEATAAAVLRLQLMGANSQAKVTGAEELPGKSNYFIGNNPKKWRTNVPTYAKVKYQNVYPGVDLVYYGNQGGELEYDFVVAPGADPNQIKLRFAGAEGTRVDAASGDLVLKLGEDEVCFHKPVVYQPTIAAVSGPDDRHSSLVTLNSSFVLASNNQVAFRVAGYDPIRALVIDPVLSYSTYLGGTNGSESAEGIAVDSSGSAYVTGLTSSADFPLMNPLRNTNNASLGFTVFVTKFNPDGSALVYSTYLGGSSYDYGTGIAVDSFDDAYVTGYTQSTNFPTLNPLPNLSTLQGTQNAFVAELNPAGSALVYSTYLGGSASDSGNAIAVDSSGDAYVTGQTLSTNFPVINSYQSTCPACTSPVLYQNSVFVSKLHFNPSTPALTLVYSTYLHGSNYVESANSGPNQGDVGNGIAVDSFDSAYVTGKADSTDFPTRNAIYPNSNAAAPYGSSAFVTKLNFNPSTLALTLGYSTFLGGTGVNGDFGRGIAVDSSGSAYVTGRTTSIDFPTVNALYGTNKAAYGSTAFVTKFSPAGSALVYSTYLGGSTADLGTAIAADSSGNAYVTGYTYSSDFPNVNAFQTTCPACSNGSVETGYASDAFVTEFNPAGSALVYSSFLGGSGLLLNMFVFGDAAYGIAVDPTCPSSSPSCNVYVTGAAISTNFPLANAYQSTCYGCSTGNNNAFVAEISSGAAAGAAAASVSPASLTFAPLNVGSTSSAQSVTLSNTGGAALNIAAISTTGDFAQTNTCTGSLSEGDHCTISVTFTPTVGNTRTGALIITDNSAGVAGSTQKVNLTGTGIDFVFSFASSTPLPAQSVSPGQTASWTIKLGGEGGFNEPVALACAGAPTGTTCTVNPASVTPGNSFTVSIPTTAPTAVAPRSRPLPPSAPLLPGPTGLLIFAVLLAGVAWAVRSGRYPGMRRLRVGLVLLAAGLLMALAMAGCGPTASSVVTPTGGTPVGQSIITVTGTAGSGATALTHTLTLYMDVS